NSTFTRDGSPIKKEQFVVYANTINNVSVVNSTNSSNFITGILWDSSDSNPGEFNASQDIVFVSKINPNKQGEYGIYNYEMRIPSELKKYISLDLTSVALYVELK
ncbi:MAG: hypothetical protein R6T92_00770, partial [Desulfosalsimonadaceae bacterium]